MAERTAPAAPAKGGAVPPTRDPGGAVARIRREVQSLGHDDEERYRRLAQVVRAMMRAGERE
jgi:hypothetical protein